MYDREHETSDRRLVSTIQADQQAAIDEHLQLGDCRNLCAPTGLSNGEQMHRHTSSQRRAGMRQQSIELYAKIIPPGARKIASIAAEHAVTNR
jgi:hypothetical protein